MIVLEKITSSLFSNLYESFLKDDDPLSTEQDWRNVFDYAWPTEQGHCGYALLDDGKVVGMMGMVFSTREIEGHEQNFCNLHTWWVREDYRGRSLILLRPLLALKGHTITHFTPCDKVRAISHKLGFSDLSTQLRILLPYGGRSPKAEQHFLTDPEQIAEKLPGHERKILADHLPYGCEHLLFSEGYESCYLLYARVVRHRLPYCHIHYISNKRIFEAQQKAVRAYLLQQHKVRFLALDHRLTQGMKFPRSFNFWSPAQGLYKSETLAPEQIDNLYSDVTMLKLTTLPNISHELSVRAKALWPFRRRAS